MGVVQAVGDLQDDALHDLGGQRPLDQPVVDAAGVHVAHNDEGQLIDLAVIMHRDDGPVLQLGDDGNLPLEAGAEGLVVDELARQHLKGHDAVHGNLAGLVDDGHAAPPDLLQDFVTAEVAAQELISHTRGSLSVRCGPSAGL